MEDLFEEIYAKFKLHFYRELFERFQNREESLTVMETFAMETIRSLGSPTINEFADFMRISSPNAAYKINRLSRKGFVRKVQSPDDRREYHLEPTEKYLERYDVSMGYIRTVVERMRRRFSPEEQEKLLEFLRIIDEELMPEMDVHPQAASDEGSCLPPGPPGGAPA